LSCRDNGSDPLIADRSARIAFGDKPVTGAMHSERSDLIRDNFRVATQSVASRNENMFRGTTISARPLNGFSGEKGKRGKGEKGKRVRRPEAFASSLPMARIRQEKKE